MKVNYKKFFAAIAAAAMCAVPMTNAMYAGAAPDGEIVIRPYPLPNQEKQAELEDELQKIKNENGSEMAKERQRVQLEEVQCEEIPRDYYIEGELSSEAIVSLDVVAFSPDHPCGNDPTLGPRVPKDSDGELFRELNTKEFTAEVRFR